MVCFLNCVALIACAVGIIPWYFCLRYLHASYVADRAVRVGLRAVGNVTFAEFAPLLGLVFLDRYLIVVEKL
jgi:hypothetical protein